VKVRKIHSRNFQVGGGSVDLEFPDRGLVLVTGPNGHGKSSLIESVAFGCWGETLRGRSPWVDGLAGELTVETDLSSVERSATKAGAKRLRWCRPGEEALTYKTATEAQTALDAVVGPFGTWRRCSVFSSADASAFSTAADRERKLLLEELLGAARFDEAVQRCRSDLSAARARLARTRQDAAVTAAKIEAAHGRLRDAEAARKAVTVTGDPIALAKEVSGLEAEVGRLRGEHTGCQVAAAASAPGYGATSARLEEAERRNRVLGSGRCPTCGAEIAAERVVALEAEVRALRDELAGLVSAQKASRASAVASASRLRDELSDADGRLREARREAAEARERARAASDAAARFAAVEASVRADVVRLGEEAEALAGEGAALAGEEALLDVVERVLGLRGVRSHVLGRALSGLEDVANSYLGRIGGGMRLTVRPTTEKRTGGTSDAISLAVAGAGGGDYAGSSGGQRRRIDIALLLGLSDLSDAARSRPPGDLWFDEVFDALDEDGVSGVSGVLAEMAEERKVVVITHSATLASALRPIAVSSVELERGRVRSR